MPDLGGLFLRKCGDGTSRFQEDENREGIADLATAAERSHADAASGDSAEVPAATVVEVVAEVGIGGFAGVLVTAGVGLGGSSVELAGVGPAAASGALGPAIVAAGSRVVVGSAVVGATALPYAVNLQEPLQHLRTLETVACKA